jgi:hypothetical protein
MCTRVDIIDLALPKCEVLRTLYIVNKNCYELRQSRRIVGRRDSLTAYMIGSSKYKNLKLKRKEEKRAERQLADGLIYPLTGHVVGSRTVNAFPMPGRGNRTRYGFWP